ncbi:MAG TPA: hypothetical protein PLN95_00375 [Candidatus Saccharibacteria bacterium]|nr:hypothetical protein [Candidatus Saccharibacteria bacterium]
MHTQKRGVNYYSRVVLSLLALLFVIGISTPASATSSSSENFQVVETEFNSSDEQCSGQYCARSSIGDLSISGTTGTGSTATFDSLTENEPLLEVIVEAGQSSVGTLSPDQPTTKTAIVKIRSYLTGGYILQLAGDPPKFGTHSIDAMTTAAASNPGTEQFGINLVENNSPVAGADPVQVPADQQTFGIVDGDYDDVNQFRYVSEDVLASSTLDWGQTHYTITMLINVSNLTPAGHFSGDYGVIVTPYY